MISRHLITGMAVLALLGPAAGAVHAQSGFGGKLAVGDGVVFIAEPTNIVRSGIVYAYARGADGAWTEAARLTAPDAEPGDRFGSAVAADGTTMLAGHASAGDGQGAVFVYEARSGTWERTGTIRPADGAAGTAPPSR